MKKKSAPKNKPDSALRRKVPLATPTDLKAAATRDITGAMNAILADVFARPARGCHGTLNAQCAT